jgi:hypothetical protein
MPKNFLRLFESGTYYCTNRLRITGDYLQTVNNYHGVLHLFHKNELADHKNELAESLLFKCSMNLFFTTHPTREQIGLEHQEIIDIIMGHFDINYNGLMSIYK